MRLTVDDVNRDPKRYVGKVSIFLNDHEVRNVLVADEEQGYIERAKMENGKLVIDKGRGEVVREKLYGKVRVVIEGV